MSNEATIERSVAHKDSTRHRLQESSVSLYEIQYTTVENIYTADVSLWTEKNVRKVLSPTILDDNSIAE